MTQPIISSASSIVAPVCFLILTSSSLTVILLPFLEATFITASTDISLIFSLTSSIDFPVIAVRTIFFITSLLYASVLDAIDCRISRAFCIPIRYPRQITVGWIFLLRRASACSIKAPTRMTAVVVPSPTSSSCVRDTSMTIFAPGC